MTGTYRRPPVTLLLGTEVSHRSCFCSWCHCSGQCWQKVSLGFPQWKRAGWACSVQHTRGGPSYSCPSGRGPQSAAVLPWAAEQPAGRAAGMEPVPPHPCPGHPGGAGRRKRPPATQHTRRLLAADCPGTSTCRVTSAGWKSYQPHPLLSIPPAPCLRSSEHHSMAIPGGGVLLAELGEKCPGKRCLLLVNPVCGVVIFLFCFQAETCKKPTGFVPLWS